MNIMHIITGDIWGGAESQTVSMLNELRKHRLNTFKVVTFNSGKVSKVLNESGFHVDIIDESENNAFDIVIKLRRIIKNQKICIVHTHGYKETLLGGVAAKLQGIESVVRTHHGIGVLESGFKHAILESFNRLLLTNHNIAVSNDLKQFLHKKKFNKDKVTVIHNAINPAVVKSTKNSEVVRSQLGISNDAIVIGGMGRMVAVKGYELFIKSAKLVLEKNNNTIFILCGSGPLLGELKFLIDKLTIGGRFRLLKFRDDAYDVLSIIDIFATTSFHEGIPMVLLEAMALEKAVVSTAVGGIPELINDGENGFLLSNRDPELLSKLLLTLCKDISLRQQIGKNAFKTIIEKFSPDFQAQQLIDLYQKVSS
jgi:L-malate glycosyltransferase